MALLSLTGCLDQTIYPMVDFNPPVDAAPEGGPQDAPALPDAGPSDAVDASHDTVLDTAGNGTGDTL